MTSKPVTQLRMLVVDDNDASAKTLGWAMELSGHEVHIAQNGPEAITKAQSVIPHVVLLDIGLPGMNGYEVCSAMKQIPELKDTIFIAQTGWSQEEHRKLSANAGFNHHLVKPIDLASLDELITNELTQK